ncbi:MAG: hypothetical protein ACFFD6_10690 [Candidatus Thorarchaeota archaeon]
MNRETERLYTPLVLRTGFMHSYRRTIPFLGLTVLLEFIWWTLGNFWPHIGELGYERWGLILILTMVLPLGVWAVRAIVVDYDDLFDVFDEDTEARLELYRSMTRSASASQEEVRGLFGNQDTYDSFRISVRQIIFEKWVEAAVIPTSIIVYAIVFVLSIYPKILGAAHSAYPLLILEVVSDTLSTLLMTLSISLLVAFGLGYLRAISHLGASRDDFGVWNYIRYLHGTHETDASFTSYWKFFDSTSLIGQHYARVAFRIVLLMALAGLSQLLFGPAGPAIWIIAGWSILIGVLILALPLNSLHKVMVETKNAMLKELDEEYDFLTLKFVSQLNKLRHNEGATPRGKGASELATEVSALQRIIENAEQHQTWPIEFPVVLRILVASLIPLFITLLDAMLTLWGIVS